MGRAGYLPKIVQISARVRYIPDRVLHRPEGIMVIQLRRLGLPPSSVIDRPVHLDQPLKRRFFLPFREYLCRFHANPRVAVIQSLYKRFCGPCIVDPAKSLDCFAAHLRITGLQLRKTFEQGRGIFGISPFHRSNINYGGDDQNAEHRKPPYAPD